MRYADIHIDFRPNGKTGVLFYSTQAKEGEKDYIYVILKRGWVVFR